jgi:membrane protease YdiL (CAAX protease family)
VRRRWSDVGSGVVVKSWTFVDFILVWLGGFVGTGLFFAVGYLFENDEISFVLALIGQYAGNLGVLWYLKRRKTDGDLGFEIETKDIAYIGVGLALQFVLALAFLPLSRWLFPDGTPPQEVADLLANIDSSGFLKLSLVIAAVVLAPVTEELVFRGVLIKALGDRSRVTLIVVSAAIFSAVHILGLDTSRLAASAAVVLPPIFILGLILGWVTLKSGRLGPAIFLHSGWNLLAAFVLLLPKELLDTAG